MQTIFCQLQLQEVKTATATVFSVLSEENIQQNQLHLTQSYVTDTPCHSISLINGVLRYSKAYFSLS